MKKFFYLFTLCLFTGLLFSSCGDDEDEVFYSGDEAKEMIKGRWSVKSMELKSNAPNIDYIINASNAYTLKNIYNMELTFKDQYVDSKVTLKNGDIYEAVSEKYHIERDKIYVDDIALGEIVSHNFILTDKRLEMTQKNIDKQLVVKILRSEGTSSEIEQIISQIPNNFSGEAIMKLQR